jgi:hypothetical protein
MLTARLSWLAGLFMIAVAFAPPAGAQTTGSYTVTLQEVLTTRSGASSVVSLEVQAQRPDGATVLQLGPEGETGRHIRIPPGLLIEANDRDKRMSTFHVSSERVTGYVRDPEQHCRRDGDEFQGEEMIGGYRSAKIVSTSSGSTRWYALDHACAMVRAVMEHPSGSKSEKVLVSLTPGPPADALFQTDGYVEGPPSALNPAVTTCDTSCEQFRKRRDADYYRLRPKGLRH